MLKIKHSEVHSSEVLNIMIYITEIIEQAGVVKDYVVFETNTESSFQIEGSWLENLSARFGFNVVNSREQSSPWYNRIKRRTHRSEEGIDYILLCKQGNKYKLIKYTGVTRVVDIETVKGLTYKNKIANCFEINGSYELFDAYDIPRSLEFEALINKKYTGYVAKSSLLGHKMSFEYAIENNKVKLIEYTGQSKNVILPSFITSINADAFVNREIETIILNGELEYIGCSAFERCNLREITIPENVKFIGVNAFHKNEKLLGKSNIYTDKVKILNNKTILFDKCEYIYK